MQNSSGFVHHVRSGEVVRMSLPVSVDMEGDVCKDAAWVGSFYEAGHRLAIDSSMVCIKTHGKRRGEEEGNPKGGVCVWGS